jgi:tetratricopeptide (TPR) repeat protein
VKTDLSPVDEAIPDRDGTPLAVSREREAGASDPAPETRSTGAPDQIDTQDSPSLEPAGDRATSVARSGADARMSGTSNHIDRYTLLSELGRGGMGVVYRAWDPQLDRTVALKMLLWGGMAGEVRRRRFMREAQAIARLEHPAIVAVHDSGVHQGCPYYTMDYVPGPTLQHRLEREGPLPPIEALRLLAVIARALHHAHERGIVHRDVKPANILLEEGVRPRIADFGIAQLTFADSDLTETGQVVGTPAYMAPEQAAGFPGETGPRADVYSLGAVLFHMITGRPPSGRTDEASVARRWLEAPSLRRTDGRVPRDVDLICRKAMAPDPADRYLDARALAEDAERFVRGEPVLASRPGLSRRLRWQLHRYRALLTGAGITLLAVLALVGAWRTVAERRAEEAQRARDARAMVRLEGLKGQLSALWKEGHDDEAARTLGAFLELSEVQETRAMALALSYAGRRELEAGRLEQAVDYHARAWLFARSEGDRVAALLDLGELFARTGDWARLRALEPLLERAASATFDLPGLATFRRTTALSARDIPSLLRQLSGGAAADFGPLLRSLGTMRPTGFVARVLPWTAAGKVRAFGPESPDHTVELIVTGDGEKGGTSGLPLRLLRSPDGYRFLGPIIDLGTYEGEPLLGVSLRRLDDFSPLAGLYRVKGDSLEQVLKAPVERIDAACAADLDGDGAPEYYLSGERQLLSVVRVPNGGFRIRPAHDETNVSNSDVQRVFAADLDGDGRLELVAAVDGWRSYDIRVFRPGAEPGRLELVARRRLGPLWDASPFPLADGTMGIAAVRYKHEPNTREFPAAAPSGMPVGVYILRLRGDQLEVVEWVPAPFRDAVLGNLVTGDFDGDGRTDFALQVLMSRTITADFQREDAYLQLVSRRPDGRLAQLTLPGLVPWVAMNLDPDRATELFARDQETGQVWLLGAGGTPLPTFARATQKAAGGETTGSTDDIWSRIETLAALGLTEVGVKELRHLAASSPDRSAAAKILVHAGTLVEANDAPAGAAALYRAAAEYDPESVMAMQRLADVSRRSKRYEVEHEALTRLLEIPRVTGPERAAAEARLELLKRYLGRQEVRLAFNGPVDSAWWFDQPHQLLRDASRRALVVRAYPGQGDLARLPLEWGGDPLTIEATLDLRRAEWGGALDIGLRPAGATPDRYLVGVRITSGGGGDQPYKRVELRMPQLSIPPVWQQLSRDPGEVIPMTLRVELDPSSREVVMVANGVERRYTLEGPSLPGPGRYELFLAGYPDGPPEYGMVEASISTLTVRGVRFGAVAGDPVQSAWRSLIEGRYAEAAGTGRGLERDRPADAALVAYLAECRAGDRDACLADLGRLVRSGGLQHGLLRSILRDQLRSSPAMIFPTLVGLIGFDALYLFRDVWSGPSMAHPNDPTVALALSTCPTDADLARLPPRRSSDMELLELGLLSIQGQAWRVLGQDGTAISRLDQARHLGERLLERPGAPDERAEVSRILSQIELNTARAYARAGQTAPVVEHLRRALERSPVRALVGEEAAAIPEIEALLGEPGVRALLNPSSYDVTAVPAPRGLE